ncbi:hypothetical protein [Saccharopolyspora pogona]|uniref:hypothetical protein n=1 Tax=Saccharopolyspora pogona TaxID=333966 RepID=UPI0016878D09|nr:hypothetical protein [Saccharopolyspora pogona]
MTETCSTLTQVQYVFIESNPYDSALGDPEYASLPEQWQATLHELLSQPDSVRCWRCDAPAGYVLREQPSGVERIEWVPIGLACEGDGPIAVLCEDCTPYVPEQPECTTIA